jgi:VCBS repeat-containing protein
VISLNFGFTATDADGDKANGTIVVKVLDDAPVAHDDGHTNVTKLVTGNVLTNDYQGTDAPSPVTKVTFNGVDYQVAETGSTVVTGQHGVLTIKADGSYTYAPTHQGSDDFTYTIVDRDGDKSSAHLGFDVKDNVCIDVNVNAGCDSVCVKEDSCVTVPVTANVTGGDGNEVVTLTLTGVASSWHFSAAGWSETSPGTYSITLPVGQTSYTGSFSFAPPADSDVDLNGLKVTASVYDPDLGASKVDEGHLNISVDAVADVPTLVVTLPASDNDNPARWTFSPYYNYKFFGHGEAYDFNIKGTATDTDGSEKITHYTIEMHPALAALGIKFSAGTEISPGLWSIDAGQEVGLKIIFPEIHGPDGNPRTSPAYEAMQGIHTMNVTTYVSEVNLSGNECDTSDNTSFNCTPVQIIIFSSPLVIDLNHDGIHLTDANNGVYFDINGDGITDKTGWVDQHDGLLALDKNHNGQIDGQSELFGGNTEDGFAVLARYDDNHDGVIDSKDAVWKDLTVWQDANHDGITQTGELITLDHLDFSSISLDAKAVNYEVSGNGISAESNITGHDGASTQIVDAWFAFYNGADADQMAEAKANEAAVKPTIVVDTPAAEVPVSVVPEDHQPVLITNFDSKVDKLDLSTLIEANNCSVTNAINDFVFSRTEGGNTIISVDASGSGSASAAVDVVVLKDMLVSHVDDIVQIAHQQQQQSGFGIV